MIDRAKAPRAAGRLAFLGLATALVLVGAGCRSTSTDLAADAPPLRALYDSPEALAQAFLDALEKEDVETLKSFALTEDEFRHHVWPGLPASKPEIGLPFDYVFRDLHHKSMSSLGGSYTRYRGRHFDFLELRFEDESTDYGTFVVHRDARVKVRDEAGKEVWLDLFGSVMECQGKFKLFSYVTD